eukprot:Nitzschia sp. Nitz4//scaffold95_size97785//55561//58838//NITZ4_004671-RA/size97785-augustus-gene-0.108-mRNA-1//-1//CDS//3329560484//3753//frame0
MMQRLILLVWSTVFVLTASASKSVPWEYTQQLDALVGIPDWYLETFDLDRGDLPRSRLEEPSWMPDRDLASVVGFVDPATCYPALETADANRDHIVTSEEYVTYVKLMGPDGYLDGIETFAELPLILQVNFNVLACLCQSSTGDDSCCVGPNAGIAIDGAYEDETATPEEASHLFIVCSLTTTAINRVLASAPPTTAPTRSPTESPTAAPTASPTLSPTASPTSPPTASPTKAPTSSPTASPTVGPTATPTKAPTPSPTVEPTSAPTKSPVSLSPTGPGETRAPTTAPSHSPTFSPTAPVTTPPTETPGPVTISVATQYEIGVQNDASQTDYAPQLIDAMGSMAPQVLAEMMGRRSLRQGRRLQIVGLPTSIDYMGSTECPSGVADGDFCEIVLHTVALIFQPDELVGAEDLADDFEVALMEAVARGDLGSTLNLLHPTTDVYILDDTFLAPFDDDSTDRDLSGGGITGIVVVGLAVIAVVGIVAARRGPAKEDEEELMPVRMEDEDKHEPDFDIDAEFPPLGAVSPDYGKGKDAMMDNDDVAAMSDVGGDGGADDSSSNAGSSGWSSSAGVSSLNTGSQDGLSADVPIAGVGAAVGAAAVASPPVSKSPSPEKEDSSTPAVSRADLDSAIEAGDWAAVGATAALLAAASDSQSYSSQSGYVDQSVSVSQSRGESNDSSLDATRAAELDHLVQSGDWEGVVLAAAKYEAAESGESHEGVAGDASTGDTSGSASASGESGNRSAAMPDTSSVGSSRSKSKKLEEYRQEVEELVRRVVPEEIQNVDEMMMQFQGREDELIETLRTMEERAVAQKARLGAQKQAKVQAKLKTSEERAADASVLSAKAAAAKTLVESEPMETEAKEIPPTEETAKRTLPTPEETKPKKMSRAQRQTALEEAIEAGDWEAVGEAAAMLSDSSLASADTEELKKIGDSLATGNDEFDDDGGSEDLDRLIEKGDWTGVVHAASGKAVDAPESTTEEEESRRIRRLKHLKEEEEALAQASIWQAIAEQTKQEQDETGKNTQAAANAADWAIGRSLQALVQAEQGERLTGEASSADGTRGAESQETEGEV